MNKLNKYILLFIMLFLNTTYLFADIGNRGRWDNGGTSNFGMSLWVLLGIIAGGFFAYILSSTYKCNFLGADNKQ